ncbi:PREDICTED: uncharacterized protein LOC101369328 [Odobenus rosmarus divergens]|uniref:Uncharacterized protein LOC101369328 n=1 Tax=Odobenus rosmarus divergens TaxID=9708 RepID=A0A9B0GTV2_ODORO
MTCTGLTSDEAPADLYIVHFPQIFKAIDTCPYFNKLSLMVSGSPYSSLRPFTSAHRETPAPTALSPAMTEQEAPSLSAEGLPPPKAFAVSPLLQGRPQPSGRPAHPRPSRGYPQSSLPWGSESSHPAVVGRVFSRREKGSRPQPRSPPLLRSRQASVTEPNGRILSASLCEPVEVRPFSLALCQARRGPHYSAASRRGERSRAALCFPAGDNRSRENQRSDDQDYTSGLKSKLQGRDGAGRARAGRGERELGREEGARERAERCRAEQGGTGERLAEPAGRLRLSADCAASPGSAYPCLCPGSRKTFILWGFPGCLKESERSAGSALPCRGDPGDVHPLPAGLSRPAPPHLLLISPQSGEGAPAEGPRGGQRPRIFPPTTVDSPGATLT